ncbi:MAG: hypothetical protein IPM74_17630 [Crocinitomicaceae bacterium]|nr:hypothetical protein [Crocinitomicaceae bacterium]
MSNKASSNLFELIKSLNKSEKRYFKLYASRHTIGDENGYVVLFDYIDKMDLYDEVKLFEDFKGQALLNKFSITKGRLYNNILKSLDSFYSASSADAQLYRQLHSADILAGKGLYGHAEKILSSAEKQSEKADRFYLMLEIRNRKKVLLENNLYSSATPESLEKIRLEEQQILNEIDRCNALWHLKSLLFHEINQKGKVRDEQTVLQVRQIADRLDEVNMNEASVTARYLYHHAKGALYFAVNDLECSFHHLKANYLLMSENPILQSEKPNYFFSLLTNLVYVATKLHFYAEARLYLNVFRELKKDNEPWSTDLELKYFSSLYSLELFLLGEQGDFKKAISLVEKIEAGYELYHGQINPIRKAYIDFKIAVAYLSDGNYTKALQWINAILNESKLDQKQDIYCFSMLINLIVHYELKNFDYLPYAIHSVKRYFKSRNQTYRFEALYLKLVNQLIKENNQFELEDKLISFQKELDELAKDPKEAVVFEYFNFNAWVKSKIQHKKFAEVFIAEKL